MDYLWNEESAWITGCLHNVDYLRGLQYTVSGHYLEAYVSRFQVRDMQSYVQTQVHQVLYTRWISGMSGFRGKFTLQ